MGVRKNNSLEWVCKQMDHVVGLGFNTNFNFALAAHVLKGLFNHLLLVFNKIQITVSCFSSFSA